MKPEEFNIIELIPQRQPMIMIDRLTFSEGNVAGGRLFITASNVLCHEGFLQEAGLIEFIGQTAAAHNGYRCMSEHKTVKQGFLVQIKNLVIQSLPAINTEIHSEITIVDELLDYTIITGRVLQNNSVIAEGELRTLMEPHQRCH
jgi:predicted hotdog family 3-hydroxylacyl-ACP dehydratase